MVNQDGGDKEMKRNKPTTWRAPLPTRHQPAPRQKWHQKTRKQTWPIPKLSNTTQRPTSTPQKWQRRHTPKTTKPHQTNHNTQTHGTQPSNNPDFKRRTLTHCFTRRNPKVIAHKWRATEMEMTTKSVTRHIKKQNWPMKKKKKKWKKKKKEKKKGTSTEYAAQYPLGGA